jgi:hypothetical protein
MADDSCELTPRETQLLPVKAIQINQMLPSTRKCAVICTVCFANPDIGKRVCYTGRVPSICQPEGTEAREQTIQEHFKKPAPQQDG